MDDLFGGSKSKSGSIDMTPDWMKNLQGPFADALLKLLGGGDLSGIPNYNGDLSAPLGRNEQKQLDLLQRNSVGGYGANSRRLLNQTLSGRFLPGQPGANPFMDAAIQSAQRPTMQGLEETLTRSLPGRFTAAGHIVTPRGSSAFDRAAGIATRGAADAMGDIATEMSYKGYNDERQRQQDAIPLSHQETDSMIKNLQAQGLPRMIQEFGIERGIELFQTRIQTLLGILGILQGATAPIIGSQSTSRTKNGIIPGISDLIGSLGGWPPRGE